MRAEHNPVGRPREWDREALVEALTKYTDETEIPILAEFAYTHGVRRDYLYTVPELDHAIKACIHKKETALERKALSGDVNCTMAIFSLKQLGWTDRQDITHKGDSAHPIVMSKADADL